MCGIAGILVASRGEPAASSFAGAVRAMLATMVHRGPDADGLWTDPSRRCVLGHRRLSIIDTSEAGRQPLTSTDGRWVVTFNGEIYNYRELTPAVAAAGMPPRGRTDTEVLANAIALWGVSALDRLDGQFAFAAFDTVTGRLILARDPFGEKPLYYMEGKGGNLAFASELQALEQLPWFDGEVSADAVAELLMFQYVGAPRTIYRQVRKLEPGHWMILDPGELPRTGRYFRFAPGEGGFTARPMEELVDELEGLLVKSIERRLIADVPLGAFLSGGVDSSTVCALISRKLGRPLETFSIGFEGSKESEHLAARRFAAHLGTQHFDQILSASASEFLMDVGGLLDEPNADSSCLPTYLLSQFARRRVTVAVSGDGGDEMFGGYGRYFATLDEARARSGEPWSAGSAYYADRILIFTDPLVRELMGELPVGLAHHVQALRAEVDAGAVPLLCRLRRSDVENYMPGAVLPKVDRMSMRHSLEVRTPYLNVELARFAERLPEHFLYRQGKGKLLLRALAYRYLPRELVDAPKQGFGLPMSRWGKEKLLGAARKLLLSEESRLRVTLGSDAMEAFMRRQSSHRGFATYQVWSLAMLESWLRHHPARLERVAGAVRSARGPRHGPRLRAIRLQPDVFAILEAPGIARNGELSEAHRADLARTVLHMCLTDGAQRRADFDAPESKWEALALPGWEEPISVADLESLAGLRGATVLIPQADAARKLDFFALDRLRHLGVRRLIYRDPHAHDNATAELDIRGVSAVRRALNALRLFLSGGIWLSWLRRGLDGVRKLARRSTDRMYVSRVLARIEAVTDEELSGRYMLFEGLRQMPPLRSSHADIAALGRGRYSVWNGRSLYSPTRMRRALTRPYWLVERTPQRERLLEFVTPAIPSVSVQIENSRSLLRHLIEKRGSECDSALTLRPGDHIALVTHALPPGGAERQWCFLAQAMKAAGYRVTFLVTSNLADDKAHYLPLLHRAGIEVVELDKRSITELMSFVPRGPLELQVLRPGLNPFGSSLAVAAAALGRLRPKAVFAQLDSVNVLMGTAALIAGVPKVVLSFRNYSPARFSYLYQPWLLPLYQELARSERVLLSGNSRAGNEDYASWLGIPSERIALIPNAVDGESIPPDEAEVAALRRELSLERDTPVILGVFRFSEEKRPELFVDICAEVIRRHPAARAFLVGAGRLRDVVAESVRARGLEDRIRLLGRRTDVAALMRVATLLLLTSKFEGMPNVVLEAQAAGLPVVASRVGGVADCIVDGGSGFLVDPDDREAFVARCLALVERAGAAEVMGRRGAAFMENFSKAALARRHVALVNGEEEEPVLAAVPAAG